MKVLMLLDNNFVNDRRVQRTAVSLVQNNFEVYLLCNQMEESSYFEDFKGVKLYRIFDASFYEFKNRRSIKNKAEYICNNYKFDIIHAHDQYMLHLGVEIKKLLNKPLIYDSHELYKHFPLNVVKKKTFIKHFIFLLKYKLVLSYYKKREKENSKHIDELITVGIDIGEILKSYFGFTKKVYIIRNTPEKIPFKVKRNYFHEKFNIEVGKKIIVYIAGCLYIKIQNLEQFLLELKDNPDVAIVLVSGDDIRKQQFINKNQNIIGSNVYFHELFNPDEISTYISSADIGALPLWNKKDLSYWYALPNKLFEYMHSGLPILAAAQPEIKNVVEKYSCGVVVNCDEPQAFRRGFDKILQNYDQFKINTIQAVDQNSWQLEKEELLKLYSKYSK